MNDLQLPEHLAADGWQLHQAPSPDLRTLAERERDDVTALQRRVEVLEQKLTALNQIVGGEIVSEDFDKLQVAMGLLVTAAITASVGADKLVEIASEQPDNMGLENLVDFATERVERFVSAMQVIGEKLKEQERS